MSFIDLRANLLQPANHHSIHRKHFLTQQKLRMYLLTRHLTPPEFVQSLSCATTTPTPAPASAPPRHQHAPRSIPLRSCSTGFDRAPSRRDVAPSSSRSHFLND